MITQQKRVPLSRTGMSLFTANFPASLVLEDEDEPSHLHLYELDESQTAKTVIVAFGYDYRFVRLATADEAKEMRHQKETGVEGKDPPEDGAEDDEELSDDLTQVVEQINSIGSKMAS
jgi:hypothetical protein